MFRSRRLFLGVGLLLVLLLVVACSPQAAPTDAPTEPPADQPTSAPAATEAESPTEAPEEPEPTEAMEEPTEPPAEGEPQVGGSVSYAFSSDWGTLDPGTGTGFTFARNIMQFIFDPLLRKNPETGEIVPGVVESFSVSDDGLVITLNLREGVTFHDGTPLDAAAVKFSWDRITEDEELNSTLAPRLEEEVASVETPDDMTVVITLTQPSAPFLDFLTQSWMAPVSPSAVEEFGADFGLNPVGTGPFRFVSTVPDERIVLERNPDYNWAPDYYDHQGPPWIEELIVLNVDEDSTRMALIETGEIDMVYNPINAQVPFFEDDPGWYVVYGTRPGVPRVFVLNTEKAPFDDPTVRQAVAWAVDRERILTEVFQDIGDVAHGVLTPGLFGHWAEGEDQWPGYDLDRAAELLEEAGWTDSDGDGILDKDGEAFSISYGQIPGFPFDQMGQILVADLNKLGIEVAIESEDQAAYLADLRAGKWELAGMLFAATDPDVLSQIAHSDSIDAAWNTARYSNPEVDALLEEARVTLDQDARAELYHQIQMFMLEDMPYVPFYVIQNPYIVNSRVQNFKSDSQAFLDFYDAYVVEE